MCKALERPNLIGKKLPIGGNIHTGKEIAQEISQKLKRRSILLH